MTSSTPGLAERIAKPDDPDAFDVWDPSNVSPFVVYLTLPDCPFTGETFFVQGGKVQRFQPWTLAQSIDADRRWTVAELVAEAPGLAPSEG